MGDQKLKKEKYKKNDQEEKQMIKNKQKTINEDRENFFSKENKVIHKDERKNHDNYLKIWLTRKRDEN